MTNAESEDFAHPGGGRRWTDVFFVVAAYLAVMTLISGSASPTDAPRLEAPKTPKTPKTPRARTRRS